MQSDLAEVVFKYLLLIVLGILIIGLCVSGLLFWNGQYSEFLIKFHLICGVTLVMLCIIHAYTKKKKLKKLTQEFANALKGKKVELECNTTRFIEALKDVSVAKLSKQFNADVAKILNEADIKVKNSEQTIYEICKANDEKIFYVFVILMEGIFKKDCKS